jgi:acetate kinase
MISDALSLREIERILCEQSGWTAIAGRSSSLEALLKRKDANARKARRILQYQMRQRIGEQAAVLGALDHIVFTGSRKKEHIRFATQTLSCLKRLGIRLRRNISLEQLPHLTTPQSTITSCYFDQNVWTLIRAFPAQGRSDLNRLL